MRHGGYKQTPLRWLWRWFAGRPLDGYPRTDCSFWYAGTKSVTHKRVASSWEMLPGWRRALYRNVAVLSLFGTGFAYGYQPRTTETILAGLLGCALAFVTVRTIRAIQTHTINSRFAKPLHEALIPYAGYRLNSRPAELISIPRDWWEREDSVMTIKFPSRLGFSPDFKVMVETVVTQKMGVTEVSANWFPVGQEPFATFSLPPKPPNVVTLTDVYEDLKTADDGTLILGMGRRRKLVTVNLDTENPHIALSMPTGYGKSVIARSVASQILRKNGRVIILDLKGSHKWARDVEGVYYCLTIPEMHDMLEKLGELVLVANHELFYSDDDAVIDTRTLIVFEEMNATITELVRYWERTRDRKTDPKESPAIAGLKNIMFMGRSAKFHILAIAQSLTAKAVGGPEVRENFGIRILGGSSRNAWKMLAPEISPIPRKSRKRGRVHVVMGDTAEETQTLWLEDKQALALVNERTMIPPAPGAGSQGSKVGSDLLVYPATVAGSPVETGKTSVITIPEVMTLRGAVESGVLPLTLANARKLSREHPRFPKPHDRMTIRGGRANVYRKTDLERFAREIESGY